MPFIETKTTREISAELEAVLRRELGSAVEIFKGKSERWLMLNFVGGSRMAFGGKTEPDCAMVSVELFGSASEGEYDAFTAKVTEIISKEAGIPKDRIYVNYSEYTHWGFNGGNF